MRAAGLELLCSEVTGAPKLWEETWKWELVLLLQQKWVGLES